MDILRNLFGNLTSGIIRLAVTVGILAAAYFFIVKPVLNTTDHAFDTVNDAMKESGINDLGKSIENANRKVQVQIQRQVRHSFKVSQTKGNTQKLVRCIQNAPAEREPHTPLHREVLSLTAPATLCGVLSRPNSAAIRPPCVLAFPPLELLRGALAEERGAGQRPVEA